MPRPKKNNADYFSHDNNMRNDRKIKALRAKFKLEGYAIWSMFLEVLAESDNFVLKLDDIEMELLAGDFEIEVDRLKEILDHLVKLRLIQKKDNLFWSDKLKERLQSFIDKREKARKNANKQKRMDNGTFGRSCDRNTEQTDISVTESSEEPDVSVTETPQSKVNESKVKEIEDLAATGGEETAVEIIPDLLANKKKKKWNDFGVEAKEINSIFAIVGKINPHLNYGNNTQREAAAELIHVHGIENMKKVAEVAVSLYNKPYAPAITTPYQLRDKYAQLKAFVEKESNKGGKIVIGSEF